jgi:hypothetical protein
VVASRNRCCGGGPSRRSLSRILVCTGRTAALELAVDADPQRLEIIVAQKLQCLRKVFRQRNLGGIRQTNTRRRLILLWNRRLNICACWRRSHHLQRVPHRADCSNVQTPTSSGLCQGHAEPWKCIEREESSQYHDRLAGLRRWANEACMLCRHSAGDAHGAHHDEAKEDDY